MIAKLEQFLESLLLGSRLAIFVAVIFGIISAFVMIILGSFSVINAISELLGIFSHAVDMEHLSKMVVMNIISAVDEYLIATVLFIFSIGLYELFIRKIDTSKMGETSSKILIIHDLDQLKEKLAKVIIIVLIVTYFKYALEMDYQKMMDLFLLSAGILLIALAVYFIGHKHKSRTNIKDNTKSKIS